jgi:hypothetical protein
MVGGLDEDDAAGGAGAVRGSGWKPVARDQVVVWSDMGRIWRRMAGLKRGDGGVGEQFWWKYRLRYRRIQAHD